MLYIHKRFCKFEHFYFLRLIKIDMVTYFIFLYIALNEILYVNKREFCLEQTVTRKNFHETFCNSI